ncbi:MAG: DNA recombination protein RmuC [Kiritimatiellia bacterium]|nr:DNA recombination protein RmuC [Kiritimatiellia bacterium]
MVPVVLAVALTVSVVAIILLARRPAGLSNEEVASRLEAKDEECRRLLAAENEKFGQLLQAAKQTNDANLDALRKEFAVLAAETLAGKAQSLSLENAKNVKPLFDQLKATFGELKMASDSAREANVKLGESLKGKLDEVGLKAQSLGRQADEFVTALKGGNKVQGNWGEGILTKVLEDAGLKRGENFVEQAGAQGAGLPDVTVFDGAHRRILIDSKVNITSFIEAVNASRAGNTEAYEAGLKEHAKSVRTQIKGLAEKNYPAKMKERDTDPQADYSEIVIMAMPSEATYAAAVTADPTLIAYANELKIVLASPQMLFGYLVLFKAGLDRLQVDRKQQEIAKHANFIVERMDSAFEALSAVGDALQKATDKYNAVVGKLGGGSNPQNVLAPAKEILRLSGFSGKLKSEAMKS